MGDDNSDLITLAERRKDRYRILVCIDGSEESYRGLNYAARLGAGHLAGERSVQDFLGERGFTVTRVQ